MTIGVSEACTVMRRNVHSRERSVAERALHNRAHRITRRVQVAPALVHARSAEEFFSDEVEAACRRQAVRPQPLTGVLRRSVALGVRPLGQCAGAGPRVQRGARRHLGPRPQRRRQPAARRVAAGRRRLAVHRRLLFRQPAPQPGRRRLLHVARRAGLSVARHHRSRALADLRRARPRSSASSSTCWPTSATIRAWRATRTCCASTSVGSAPAADATANGSSNAASSQRRRPSTGVPQPVQ